MPLMLAAALVLGAAARAPGPSLDGGLWAQAAGGERAAWATRQVVGSPYVLSPLGEGRAPDPDPRFRLDAFDCVTLVETAIALGNARTVAEAAVLLDDIRYEGEIDFEHRNHYVESQWLPTNARKGWIADATARIAGSAAVTTQLRHTPDSWRAAAKAGHVVRGLAPASLPTGDFPITYVSLRTFREMASRIPAGTVILLVREARPPRPYRVTHMGLVVGAGGSRVVRHASTTSRPGRVVDEPIETFARRHERQRSWPVLGMSLWTIRDNADRARRLTVPVAAPGALFGAQPRLSIGLVPAP